ncbi:MAG: penicillin-binding protein 1C, partial [Alphaproteobacteria bacterium]
AMARRRGLLAAAAGFLLAAATLAAADRLAPPPLDRHAAVSTVVTDRDGGPLHVFLAADDRWRLPVSAGEVDPLLLRMLRAYEDRRFDWHPGVDPLAIARALGQWIAAGRVVSGGSTLTMQTARLLEPRPRTLPAKLAEAARALQLERRLDKREILSIYLTLAPYGGNIEGVRAASLAYFGKEPAALRPAEAALLVVLPQAPERLRPDRHPAAARAARDKVIERMVALDVLDAAAAAEARAEPVPAARIAMASAAPHLARRLRAADPAATVIRSTIDGRLQRQLEALVRREARQLEPTESLAAIVLDNRSRGVLAYVGSPDPFAVARDGAVDMVRAVRSPGSTLKPVIYAIAFDGLQLHPETLLDDRPTRFDGYAPANFDHGFRGRVTAREALQLSLNVPAVAVLQQIGAGRFAARLADLGIDLRTPDRFAPAALPIALGGVGVTLVELAGLYAALADDGGHVAPMLRPGPLPERRRLVGRPAAWQVSRILEDAPPPPGTVPGAVDANRAIAVKTGTSYGFRDAWALGYDGLHTVGIWTGRPDGTPAPGRYGLVAAAPVLHKAFDLLPPAPVRAAPAMAALAPRPAPALRRLGPGGTRPPTVSFPPDGATLPWRGQASGGVPLLVEGGRAPHRWLVDGRPIDPADGRSRPTWMPSGRGFARLTVIDADGRGDSATVRID